MSETTKPRNVDGQIVCPPGYTLKPDGMCHAGETVIEKVEEVISGVVTEVEKVAETVVEKVKEVLGLETKTETKEPETPASAPVVSPNTETPEPTVEHQTATSLNVAVETPKHDAPKGDKTEDKANAGSDHAQQ